MVHSSTPFPHHLAPLPHYGDCGDTSDRGLGENVNVCTEGQHISVEASLDQRHPLMSTQGTSTFSFGGAFSCHRTLCTCHCLSLPERSAFVVDTCTQAHVNGCGWVPAGVRVCARACVRVCARAHARMCASMCVHMCEPSTCAHVRTQQGGQAAGSRSSHMGVCLFFFGAVKKDIKTSHCMAQRGKGYAHQSAVGKASSGTEEGR